MKKLAASELRSFEYSEWSVVHESIHLRVIIIYRTPYSDVHPVTTSVFFTEFADFLESIALSSDPLLITGDFNIHVDCTDNPDTIRFFDLLESTGLEHVMCATHHSDHTLDLIITRQTESIIANTPKSDYLFSDHYTVLCSLKPKTVPLSKRQISFRKIKSVDLKLLQEDLSHCSV